MNRVPSPRQTAAAALAAALGSACLVGRAQVREGGIPRCDRMALAGFTTSREAVSSTFSAASLSGRVSVGSPAQVFEMFERMIERGGPFQFIPAREQLSFPGFSAIAQQHPSRTAFASDADLYSPPGFPFLPDEPSRTLVRQIIQSVTADSALWGRVRFELRTYSGFMGSTTATVVASVEVAVYDGDGQVVWRDSSFSESTPVSAGRGFIPPTTTNRAGQDAMVAAMGTLLDRLNERLREIAASRGTAASPQRP